jgi:hypothetical protein
MGEKSLPARKGREVRGLESIKLRAVAAQATWVGRCPPPRLLRRRYSPTLSGGGRDDSVAGTPPPFRAVGETQVGGGVAGKGRLGIGG